MNRKIFAVAGLLAGLAASPAALAQQESGRVGAGMPEDIVLSFTAAENGALALSQSEFRLAWGGYYRFNLECPAQAENEVEVGFLAPEFWENAHLRVVSVSEPGAAFQNMPEINFHLQGLSMRRIDCEGLAMSARFSFHPMRKGTYPFTVLNNMVDPPQELTGSFIVE